MMRFVCVAIGLLMIVASMTGLGREKALGPLSFLAGAALVLGTLAVAALRRGPSREDVSPGWSADREKVSLAGKFALIHDHWNPRIVGELNGQHVKLVKFRGEFVWHHHDREDEFFLVVRGSFRMEFRDRTVTLEAGEFLIVPRGVEHRPVADEEVEVLLFEPAGTVNTGSAGGERTVPEPERL